MLPGLRWNPWFLLGLTPLLPWTSSGPAFMFHGSGREGTSVPHRQVLMGVGVAQPYRVTRAGADC